MSDLGAVGRFFVAVTFAVIGFYIGGWTGAAIGFSLGNFAGGLIFPTQLPSITAEGPRLSDLSGTTSAYGKPIPIGYGLMRVPGNCTWLKGNKIDQVKVVKKETVEGGKGGGSEQEVTTIEYHYYATFRISFAEATGLRVLKIWGDTKLLYDITNTTSAGSTPSNFKEHIDAIANQSQNQTGYSGIRFYSGDENQQPDFREVADRGTAPAYRGQCSIVFDRLALRKFGNRIPSITALIAFNYDSTEYEQHPSNTYDDQTLSFNGEHMAYDNDRRFLYAMNTTTDTLYKISVPDMVTVANNAGANFSNVKILAVDEHSGYIYGRYGTANNTPIVTIDPNSLEIAGAFPSDYSTSIIGQNTPTSFAYADYMCPIPAKNISDDGVNNFVLVSSIFGDMGVLVSGSDGSIDYVMGDSTTKVTETEVAPPFGNNDVGGAHAFWVGHQSSQITIYKTIIGSAASYTVDEEGNPRYIDVSPPEALVTFVPSDMGDFDSDFAYITSFTNTRLWSYDPDGDQCIGCIKTNGNPIAISVDATSGSINWITEIDSGNGLWGGKLGNYAQDLSNTHQYVLSYSNKVDVINKYTGEYEIQKVTNSVNTWNTTGQWNSGWFYDPNLDAILGKPTSMTEAGIIFLNRVNITTGLSLKTITDDVMDRCNLDPSQYDNTELADTEVQGYFITRPMSGRAALQPLAGAYLFDIVETDYQLKSYDRGRSSSLSVTQADLAEMGDQKEPFPINRRMEQELPMRVTVSYVDRERDYQISSQQEKRTIEPTPSMYSVNEMNIELPLVMNKDDAAQLAEKLLRVSWTERDQFTFKLSQQHLKLTPADVIDVTLDDGTSYNIRLATVDVGADYSMELTGVTNEIASYSSSKTGKGDDIQGTLDSSVNRATGKIHQLPLLSDNHDLGRSTSVIYIQAAPIVEDVNWVGCSVYASFDEGITWQYKTSVSAGMCWGTVSDTLADPPSSPFDIDTESSITLWVANDADQLNSINDTELLTGQYNLMRVGNEVINFRDVTANADGSYTISHFLRGRRGTDTFCYGHAASEKFYLLTTETVTAMTIDSTQVGSSAIVKFVGEGQIFEDVPAQRVTFTGEDLKPYAPVSAIRTDDTPATSDITLSWDRRTRLYGDWEDDYGSVPLQEETELYEIAILNESGGDEIETLVSTTESVVFDSEDVIYHFGAPPATLYVKIYQISSDLPGDGRGFAHEFALT